MIFQKRYRNESISWDELDIQAPGIRTLSDSMTMRVGNDLYLISVSLQKGVVGRISCDIEVFSLVFNLVRHHLPLDG
jgi:hypothetical protein